MFLAKASHPESPLVIGQYLVGEVVLPDYEVGYLSDSEQIRRMYLEERLPFHAWNKLVSRYLVLEHSLYFVEGIFFEDVPWSSRLFSIVRSVVFVPMVTYYYQDNPTSIMRTIPKRADKAIRSYLFSASKVFELRFAGLYAVHRLFIFRVLVVNAIDLYVHFDFPAETKQMYLDFRRRLMGDVIRNRRFLIAAFFLLMYAPFSLLLRSRLFRNHFDQLYRLVMRLSR